MQKQNQKHEEKKTIGKSEGDSVTVIFTVTHHLLFTSLIQWKVHHRAK